MGAGSKNCSELGPETLYVAVQHGPKYKGTQAYCKHFLLQRTILGKIL
jgi:hypothetical protein